ASRVSFELMARWPLASCSCDPKEYMMARMAMAVSSSADRPTPTGMPVLSLIFFPPTRMSSQVSGFIPISLQRSDRELIGSGTHLSEKAKYFLVFGLYVLLMARSIGLPCFFSHSS